MQIKDNFEGQLKNIDLYFESKPKNTFQSYCVLIVIAIFGLAYFLYYEDMYNASEEVYNTYEQSEQNLAVKKNEYESYFGNLDMSEHFVNDFVNQRIVGISNQIANVKKEIEITDNTRVFFRNKLNELSYLLFSNMKGAEFSKSLTSLAESYKIGINILGYDDLYRNGGSMQQVSPVLNIEVELFGEFQDIIRYINSIEKSQMVVDVNFINFYKIDDNTMTGGYSYNNNNNNNDNMGEFKKLNHKQVNVKMKISIWGVN